MNTDALDLVIFLGYPALFAAVALLAMAVRRGAKL
jgi:hypothetical protein